jgi:hypothetical protein
MLMSMSESELPRAVERMAEEDVKKSRGRDLRILIPAWRHSPSDTMLADATTSDRVTLDLASLGDSHGCLRGHGSLPWV